MDAKDKKQQFIDALVNFKDGCKGFYEYRVYFLAAAGIAEFRNYKADGIVDQIVKWTIDDRSLIREEVRSALQQTDRTKAIAALVQLLQSNNLDNYNRRQVAYSLGEIIQDNKHRFAVVKALSGYSQLVYQYYNFAWKCAQNMPYPDFYQAWHQYNVATRAMQSLIRILFTRII